MSTPAAGVNRQTLPEQRGFFYMLRMRGEIAAVLYEALRLFTCFCIEFHLASSCDTKP